MFGGRGGIACLSDDFWYCLVNGAGGAGRPHPQDFRGFFFFLNREMYFTMKKTKNCLLGGLNFQKFSGGRPEDLPRHSSDNKRNPPQEEFSVIERKNFKNGEAFWLFLARNY